MPRRATTTAARHARWRTACALAIAGSDSGGGAGIQADLKAFARCGVHGMTAITAITAQNTVGVSAIAAIPPDVIVEQVRAVARDIGVDAVKVGMLGTRDTVLAVARALDELRERYGAPPVVVDPVMVSESGARLLDADAEQALIAEILPRATVVTPNIPEAAALCALGAAMGVAQARPADAGGTDARELARALHALGPAYVVITGGHGGEASDVFYDGRRAVRAARRATRRRCRPRLRLHAFIGARGAARARPHAAGRGPRGPCAGRRGGRKWAPRHRRRGRSGRRSGRGPGVRSHTRALTVG